MNPRLIVFFSLPLFILISCVEHKNAIHENLKQNGQFMLRKSKYQSRGCTANGELSCIQIETSYPEMLFGPALLQKKVNRKIERHLGKMLLQSFPYLSSGYPRSQIEELINLYNYKYRQVEGNITPQKVGIYGSWKESESDFWVFKLEVWVQNEGEAPIVLQKWISLDRESAHLVATKEI